MLLELFHRIIFESHMDNSKLNLQTLLDKIPEIYQPIFGHPELSTRYSRDCSDRLPAIKQIYAALAAKLDRSLRVLDLGCAQGYFSLHLAEMGATVYGIDFERVSIDVCNARDANTRVHIRQGCRRPERAARAARERLQADFRPLLIIVPGPRR